MGHFLVNDTGSSEELWELISNALKVLQCCERCLQQVETGTAELEDCKIVCHDCTTSRQLLAMEPLLGTLFPSKATK